MLKVTLQGTLQTKSMIATSLLVLWLPYYMCYLQHTVLRSVLWRCWLGDRKGIRPVKKLSSGMLAWLSVWREVQTCVWPSWCHCHSLSLASVKSRLVLPFWYRLTSVVPDKGPLNGCVCVCACPCSTQTLYFPSIITVARYTEIWSQYTE